MGCLMLKLPSMFVSLVEGRYSLVEEVVLIRIAVIVLR